MKLSLLKILSSERHIIAVCMKRCPLFEKNVHTYCVCVCVCFFNTRIIIF